MSTHLRIPSLAILTTISVACSGPTEGAPVDTPKPPLPEVLSRLELTFDSQESFAGLVRQLHVSAYSTRGIRMSSGQAVVTSWNPSVATVEGVQARSLPTGGQPITDAFALISARVAGSAVIRVKLGDIIDSTVVNVRPLPLATNALAVDSFTVVEYYGCTSCGILSYAPALKLREPTGTSFVDVVAVEFNIPNMTTGFCTTSDDVVRFSNGLSAYINYVDRDDYANVWRFWVNGTPVPDGMASARVVVRDARGTYGLIEAKASIQRMVQNPTFPPAYFVGVPWSCNGRWP